MVHDVSTLICYCNLQWMIDALVENFSRNVALMCASIDGVESFGSMSLVSLAFLWKIHCLGFDLEI